MRASSRHLYILVAVSGYVILALSWIFLSDRLLLTVIDTQALVRLSMAKGVFFVLASATAFYIILHVIPPEAGSQAQPARDVPADGTTTKAWPRWLACLFGVVLVFFMLIVRVNLSVSFADRPLLILFMLPIVLAALLGGFGPGLLATLAAAAATAYHTPPAGGFAIGGDHDLFQWSLLIVNGLTVSMISEAMHRLRGRDRARLRQLDVSNSALRQSEERLKLFIEHAPAALAMFDRDMCYLSVSQRWLDDYGLKQQDLLGRSHYEVFPELGEELRAVHHRGLAGEIIRADEDHFRRADGSSQWLRWEVHPWYVDVERVGGIVIFSEDISEQKQAQEILRQRSRELEQRNADLERFSYAISHELKTPLVTIKTFIGFLERSLAGADTERTASDLHYIRTAADRMSLLLDDLLRLSRTDRPAAPAEEMTYNDLIREILLLVAGPLAEGGIATHIDEHELRLRGDRLHLTQIWQNLIENSVKFMGDQPEPRIEIGVDGASSKDPVFFVRDNGIGIDQQYAKRIFGLFDKLDTSSAGSGLGLALAKRVVELNGGRIWVESAGTGQGSCFRFTLPQIVAEP